MPDKGTLYLVATPIGNLEDITLRAIRILKEVDLIAAEDTRKTLRLLNHLEISKPLTSFFRHNEGKKGETIIQKLLEGQSIALVSDAGTPGISDPGEELVSRAVEEGINVVPVPGPTAFVAGLIASGLPTGRFVFEGFIPMNKRTRKERIESLKGEQRTMIFYEAPHKLVHTLKDMYAVWGERKIVIVREITKVYEEKKQLNLSEAVDYYQKNLPRGEFVLIIEGKEGLDKEIKPEEKETIKLVEEYINSGMDKKEAIKKAAKEKKISKREVYNELLKQKN